MSVDPAGPTEINVQAVWNVPRTTALLAFDCKNCSDSSGNDPIIGELGLFGTTYRWDDDGFLRALLFNALSHPLFFLPLYSSWSISILESPGAKSRTVVWENRKPGLGAEDRMPTLLMTSLCGVGPLQLDTRARSSVMQISHGIPQNSHVILAAILT